MSAIAKLRRFWWRHVRRHHYEICGRCGRPASRGLGDTYWFADNPLWNEVEGGAAGIRCPRHFFEDARALGIDVAWRAGRVGEIEDLVPAASSVSKDGES